MEAGVTDEAYGTAPAMAAVRELGNGITANRHDLEEVMRLIEIEENDAS